MLRGERYRIGNGVFSMYEEGVLITTPYSEYGKSPDEIEDYAFACAIWECLKSIQFLLNKSRPVAPRDLDIDAVMKHRGIPLGLKRHDIYLGDLLQSELDVYIDYQNRMEQRQPAYEEKVRQVELSNKKGFVYLIKSSSGYYKIGRTKKPDDRMNTFTVKLPFEVEYECLIESIDMYSLEKDLHERFSEKRVNGEWFNLESQDIEYIKGLSA